MPLYGLRLRPLFALRLDKCRRPLDGWAVQKALCAAKFY